MKTSKILRLVMAAGCAGAAAATLASCGGNNGVTKIGVLVADVSGDEALGFKAYLEQYVGPQYNYQFVYSTQIDDAAGAKTAAETFISQNCKAIIDMADKNRGELASLCNQNHVYFAIGSGMMSDDDYAASKGLEYFVGQIGPDMQTEYDTGYKMGVYYKDNNQVSNVGIYGAFVPNPMHLYRLAGLLTGLGDTYDGASGHGIVHSVFGSGGQFDATKIAGPVGVKYAAGFDPATIFDTVGGIIGQGVDAFLSVGMTTTFFSSLLNGASVNYSDIDSFTAANGENMKTGSLKYLSGKYSSSLGPIFAATKSAIDGKPIRNEAGEAFSISQDYWTATSYAEFEKFQSADSVSNPIFNKELLDTLVGASYANFSAAVRADRTPKLK